jgi:hypothetical protein
LRLDKIAAVDRPCQEHATVAIVKRAPEDPAARVAKATFQEALEGQMVASRVNEAFYQSFNGLWERNDAFRCALTDELAEGGDGSTASADYVASVKALVDTAVTNARTAGTEASTEDLVKAFTTAAEEWLADQEHVMKITNRTQLTAAIQKFQADGDSATQGDAAAITKAAADLNAEDLLPATGPLAKSAPAVDPSLAARLDRMDKRDALGSDVRKHYDTLTTDADRDAFLALDSAAQAAEMAKAGGDDPVVYTTLDGLEVRKSAGDAVIAALRSADTGRRELAKALAGTEDTVLTKRAGDELGHIGGDLIGKKALLKAVGDIADEPARNAALAVLKAADTAASKAFIRKGSGAGGPVLVQDDGNGPEMTEAEAELDELAKARAKEGNITFEKAYTEVLQTPTGQALYKRFTEGDE